MSVEKFANDLFNAGIVVMIFTLVLSLGLGFTVRQILEPTRHWVVLLALAMISLGAIPAIAWGVATLFPLTSHQTQALALMCCAAGGPMGLKIAALTKRANMAMAVMFVVVLQLLNIVIAPLWARAIVTGATVKTGTIIGYLLILVLIPLALGLIGRARYTEHAAGWKAALERVSNVALYIAIVMGAAVNWKEVVSLFGSWVLVCSILLILINMALGFLVGLKDRPAGLAGLSVTSEMFTPIGLIIIGTQLHNQGTYLAPALVFAAFDTFIPVLIGVEIGRYLTRPKNRVATGASVSAPAAHAPATTGLGTATAGTAPVK
jgi:BASS family bile acid:Na+ symporter